MARLAILAGAGDLPVRLANVAPDALCIGFEGVPHDLGPRAQIHKYEHMGALFETLRSSGVTEVVMAGAMSRPPLDPAAFDRVMQNLAPRLMAAMQGGDDALLRLVITIFEEQGFNVRAAHDIDPSLTAAKGLLAGGPLSAVQEADCARAIAIHAALAPQDVAQGCVVEAGLCLGIETLQGTDAMLHFVGETQPHLRKSKGVFLKAPKAGQDLRVDMPTIGPATIEAVAKADLGALVIAAHSVLIVQHDEVLKRAEEHAITLLAREI